MDEEGRGTTRTSYSNIVASDQARQHLGDIYNISNTFALPCRQTSAAGSPAGIHLETCVSGLKDLTDSLVSQITSEGFTESQPNETNALPQDFVCKLVESQATLTQLKSRLPKVPYERASLIQADHLLVWLTKDVLLFSDVQRYLQSFGVPNHEPSGPLEEAYDKPDATSLLQSLIGQCSIWRTQLDLLQCSSDEEAHDKSCVLEASTSSLLAENADMKRRMDCIERQVAELIRGQNSGSESFRRSIDTNYAQEQVGDVDFDFWQFEKDLEHSWVYKRNEHRESMMSFHSSVGRDDAWSELSKLKLAHLSVISVIALPVERSEIVDSSWYQTSTVTANSIIRSRTWAKAPVREKTPMPSQATGSSHAVSLLAAELFKVDSLERQVIRIIDQIALEIRAGSVAGMKSSLDRAEFELSKALRGFKKREETLRRDTSDLQESSLLSYELEIAFALLNACKDKGGRSFCSSLADAERDLYSIKSSHDTQAPCNRKSRVSLAPVRGVLKNMTRNVLKDSIDASRDTHTPPSAEKKSSSLYSLARRRKFGHLDDLVFLYEGLATLDLSDLNLSKLPYRDLQGMTKKLHIIVLDDNRISDFKDVKAFSNDVKVLQIRRNGLMHFPEAILRLRLSSLDISHNYIDQIPTYVTKMAELRELAMQGNAFDKLPAEIWQMEQLERLFVQWEVWRSWCEMNGENVDWRVVERYDEGLYTLGWAELERTRFLPGYEEQ